MELHFFPLRERNRLNCSISLEVSDANRPGSGYISTRNMVAELPVVLDVLSDGLLNYLAAAASTFRQGNQQSASTSSSPDVAQT